MLTFFCYANSGTVRKYSRYQVYVVPTCILDFTVKNQFHRMEKKIDRNGSIFYRNGSISIEIYRFRPKEGNEISPFSIVTSAQEISYSQKSKKKSQTH